MRFFKLFLCCMPFLFMSCSDSTGPGDAGDGELLASENIGAGGGTISSDEIELSVPSGAFGSETAVALTTAPEKPFEDDAVSGTYVIAGLPQSYSEEITVSIAFTGELTENSYIAVGVDTWVSSFGEMAMTYSMLPATVDGNKLTAALPATGLVAAKAAMKSAEESSSLTVTAVTGYTPHVTAGGHFKIEYASRWTTLVSVHQLGQYLEEAYTTIAGLGFSYAGRTNWPVSVTVKNLDDEVFGYSSNSLWGDNYGYLEFNAKKMADLAELRTTAGHEFFHLVQALYDPRNFYSKAKLSSPHLWLDEACAVWIEEKFTDQQNYVSAARAGNVLAPFNGVVAGAADDAGKHDYGLSAMIKYLVGEHGESCLPKIYDALKSGSHPMAAVRQGTAAPVEWWEEFLRQYTCGEIYGAGIAELTANKSGMFRVITDSDSLAMFTGEYPDLSGGLYVIRLEDTSIGKGAVLSLSVEGGMSEVTALKYRMNPFDIAFIGTDAEEVIVTDLQSLTDDGWHLIVLVSNSRSIDPYKKKTTIDLTARVKKPINPGFMYFNLYVSMIGDFDYSYQESDTHSFSPGCRPAGYGTVTATTFSGAMDGPLDDGYVVGNYTITFDADFQNILHIEANQRMSFAPGVDQAGLIYQDVTITAHDIPLFEIDQQDRYVYDIRGDRVEDHVTSLTWEIKRTGKYSVTQFTNLMKYHSNEYSELMILLWTE